MTDTTLLHIVNPRTFLIPDFQTFMLKALATSPLIPDAWAALLELSDVLHDPTLGLFAVMEGNQFVGMTIAHNNSSALSPGCGVLHFYNKGSAAARKALVEALIGFAKAGGHTKIWGVDINQSPEAFARLFKAIGPATSVGDMMGFEISS